MGSIGDEIIRPHVIRALRPQAKARTIVEPQPSAFGLLAGHFKPLPPPDSLHPLGINPPAFGTRQRRDAAVAVAAVGADQPDDRRGQRGFVIPYLMRSALGRARLADGAAGAPFRDLQLPLDMHHALASAFRA